MWKNQWEMKSFEVISMHFILDIRSKILGAIEVVFDKIVYKCWVEDIYFSLLRVSSHVKNQRGMKVFKLLTCILY